MSKQMNDADYRRLFEFRARLLRFLRASDQRIRDAGLTPTHYLLLLGIRAAASSRGPTIGDMADFLILKHHSVVELVDRAETAGLIKRSPDPDLLLWCEREARVLVSLDKNTLPVHLANHLQTEHHSPGVFIPRPSTTTQEVLEALVLAAYAGDLSLFVDCVTFIP